MDNNTVIFLVLSNLKHNGDMHLAGSFIEGNRNAFASLVADKTVREVEGASTVAEAKEIVAAERDAAQEGEEAPAPERDTWAPTDEPAEAPVVVDTAPEAPVATPEGTQDAPKPEETPATENAPVKAKYTVQADNGIQLEGEADKTYAKGETVELDPATDQAKFFIENGIVTLFDEAAGL